MSRKLTHKNLPRLSYLKSYLRSNGWQEQGRSENYTLFTNHLTDGKLELIVAQSENIRGWEKSVALSIQILSEYFGNSIDDIISKIICLSIKYDVFRSRIADTNVRHDTIDMETAVEYVSGLKSLMTSAAAAEIKKEQLVRRSPPQAAEYGRKCRFGHTFKGSFGFMVESPIIIAPPEEALIPSDEDDSSPVVALPFERRVVERIATGMTHLQQAVSEQNTSAVVNGFENGLNANMLDDLLSLHDAAKYSRLTFDFQWSPDLPELKIAPDFDFDFGSEKIEIVESASRELKRTKKPEREIVAGYVTDLHTDFDLKAPNIFHDDRKIIVKISYQGYTQRRLHISLNETDYSSALTAHETGQLISVSGKMEKRGRYWYLIDPEGFKIIS
jgi:hypothetical protein